MPRLSLIRPLDQPAATRRLLHDLEVALVDERLSAFKVLVAYAKSGPLLRLHDHLVSWRTEARRLTPYSASISGGTSKEGAMVALHSGAADGSR